VIKSAAHDSIVYCDAESRQLLHAPVSEMFSLSERSSKLLPISLELRGDRATIGVYSGGWKELCVEQNGALSVSLESKTTRFDIEPLTEFSFALKHKARFLCAERRLGGEAYGSVTVSRAVAREWETFSILCDADLYRRVIPIPHCGSLPASGKIFQIAQWSTYGAAETVLRDTTVTGKDWSALTSDGEFHLAPMSHMQRLSRQNGGSLIVAVPDPKPVPIDEAYLLGGFPNFYHHIVDYMINWFGTGDGIDPKMPVLVNESKAAFHKEIAVAFGIANPLICVPDLTSVRVQRLHLPRTAVSGDGFVREREIFEKCVAYLKPRLVGAATKAKRVFVSRKLARTRCAINESEAIDIASAFGFEAVCLEELDFCSQVVMFLQAEAVIGLHGAGLTHLIFLQAGSHVVECFPSGGAPNAFQNLARGLGLKFSRVPTTGHQTSPLVEIDLSQLSATLRAIF